MVYTMELNAFINLHKSQLTSANIPEIYWKTLHRKLTDQTFDIGGYARLLKLENDSFEEQQSFLWALQAVRDIDVTDAENIFLIDHAWTFRIETAKAQLKEHESLRQRLCNMLNINESLPLSEIVDKIFDSMFKISNYYCIASAESVENRLPIWYIMDEVGSALIHSDEPNCRVVPFVNLQNQLTYSLLFPVKDIEAEDFLYKDFAEGEQNPDRRSAVLYPWVPENFKDLGTVPPLPDEDYFLEGHIEETLPDLSKLINKTNNKDVLTVFSQYELIKTYLTSNSFDIVEDENEADILWYTKHFKDFNKLSCTPWKFVNQFPFEFILTIKDLLCITCRRSKNSQQWLPHTYNLLTELNYFISCYKEREEQGLDNYWIVKPYNLARGLDIHITNNLDMITRLAITGPKVVQKYITEPVLFYREECDGKVKFDIRYVILLKNVRPLESFIYKKFFLRFANKPFDLTEFQDYEKHFTVMNYKENVNLKHLKCETFIDQFKLQYPDHSWEKVEKLIIKMLRDILEAATVAKPPCGLAESPQSRALYAADIMLEWNKNEMEPRILEINFMPDCKRACEYYPDFYDDIFSLLFLNEISDDFFAL